MYQHKYNNKIVNKKLISPNNLLGLIILYQKSLVYNKGIFPISYQNFLLIFDKLYQDQYQRNLNAKIINNYGKIITNMLKQGHFNSDETNNNCDYGNLTKQDNLAGLVKLYRILKRSHNNILPISYREFLILFNKMYQKQFQTKSKIELIKDYEKVISQVMTSHNMDNYEYFYSDEINETISKLIGFASY